MGKKRIEKIMKIENAQQRKVCLCKRKKGLLKKAIELSLLCDLDVFTFVYDRDQNRVTHFASNENIDFMSLFNTESQREFFSNKDYSRVGGRIEDLDDEFVTQILAERRKIKSEMKQNIFDK